MRLIFSLLVVCLLVPAAPVVAATDSPDFELTSIWARVLDWLGFSTAVEAADSTTEPTSPTVEEPTVADPALLDPVVPIGDGDSIPGIDPDG